MMNVTEKMFIMLNKQGKTIQSLCDYLDIKSNVIANWKKISSEPNSKHIPPAKYLVRICEFLNISCDYLLTGKERSADLTEREELLIKWYRECNQEGKDHIMQTADMVKDKYKKADTISGMENIVG